MKEINTTRLYSNGQTASPSEIRKKHDLNENSVIEWIEKEDEKIEINFKEEKNIKETTGKFKSKEKQVQYKTLKTCINEIRTVISYKIGFRRITRNVLCHEK